MKILSKRAKAAKWIVPVQHRVLPISAIKMDSLIPGIFFWTPESEALKEAELVQDQIRQLQVYVPEYLQMDMSNMSRRSIMEFGFNVDTTGL
jgi:hypothetical protein